MKKETQFDDVFDFPELSRMSANTFYKTYKYFMHSIARNEGLDRGQADMAIDDVLITIFMKHACYFDPRKGLFSNYLATMVRNACRSLRRRDHRYVNVEEEDLLWVCEENGAVTGNSAYEPGDIRRYVEEGIRILRKEVRSQLMVDVLVMQVIDGERPMDIARRLNVRPDYVSLAKNRCLPRLRAIVREIMSKDK